MATPLSTFVPYYSLISDIALGVQTVVTFTAVNSFSIGQIISFRVSAQYGTVELNNLSSLVLARDDYTITVPIDSTWFTPFIPNPSNPQALAMVVPSSSGIVPGAIPPQSNLLDVFDNVPET